MTTLKKYLVYEAYEPPYEKPYWKAVEASGERGRMMGLAPESRVYSFWGKDSEAAVEATKRLVGET